jgi:hypothetical protein
VNQSDADVQIGDRRHEETGNTVWEEAHICGAMLWAPHHWASLFVDQKNFTV